MLSDVARYAALLTAGEIRRLTVSVVFYILEMLLNNVRSVLRCPPLQLRPSLSSPAMSSPATPCSLVNYRPTAIMTARENKLSLNTGVAGTERTFLADF